jgi:DNA-directed RNA polymerase subunit RPC12/RpoP
MPDKTLICKDCNAEFIFSEGEQEFYKEKGFENEPLRCPECRRRRKQQRRQNQNRYNEGSSW